MGDSKLLLGTVSGGQGRLPESARETSPVCVAGSPFRFVPGDHSTGPAHRGHGATQGGQEAEVGGMTSSDPCHHFVIEETISG